MRMPTRRMAATAALALVLPSIAIATPAVSSADPLNCENGWWDPAANVCRPPVGAPLDCENGWWDPVANVCRPPVGAPLNCENGWWWDPVNNVCAPPVLPQ